MTEELKAQPNDERLLRIREVAERLSLQPLATYKLVWSGELPAVRFRRSVRVRPADLALFIDNHRTGKGMEAVR